MIKDSRFKKFDPDKLRKLSIADLYAILKVSYTSEQAISEVTIILQGKLEQLVLPGVDVNPIK